MKIGLVRHFKVMQTKQFWMSSSEFQSWVDGYNCADVAANSVELHGIDWHRCYASNLPRAVTTAETIYQDNVIIDPLLTEVPLSPFISTNMKLPHALWSIVGRLSWFYSLPLQQETKQQTIERAKRFLSTLKMNENENILIVSHGFFLYYLSEELRQNGFQGNKLRRIKNGELYLFQKTGTN